MASGSSVLHRNRDFMLLWSGQALSGLGSQISVVAYPLLVLALTHSPAKAGITGFAKALPIFLLALPAGALADRMNRKYLMVASDGVRAVALIALSIMLAVGNLPFGMIVAVAFVDGAGFVVSYVAERGALRQLVPDELLGEAVARNESRLFAANLAGPPIGGLLFGLARAVPFVADAVSYVASTASMLLIKSEFQEPRDGYEPRRFKEGFLWIWQRPFFRTCSLLFAGSNPIFTGLTLLAVVLAKRHGASSLLVGLMLAIAAGGGLVGALLAPRLRRILTARSALVGESWLMVLALPWLLLVHNALLIGLIIAVAELITPVTNSIVVAYRVALAPDRLQGRVQAASTVISFAAAWLGPLVVGVMLQRASTTATVLVLTGWALMLAVVATAARSFRHPPGPEDLVQQNPAVVPAEA
jgi:predicted MFS family arabinose efflux permease